MSMPRQWAARRLDASRPLAEQLRDVFSRTTSPIWMDSSTTSQCAAIEAAVGAHVRHDYRSRAFERFTGFESGSLPSRARPARRPIACIS
jgi:xylulokinase